MPQSSQPLSDQAAAAGGAGQAFDVRTSRELGQASRPGRLIFALIFAVISLSILPLQTAGLWLSIVIAWELFSSPLLDRIVNRLSNDAAISAFGVVNFIGSSIFAGIPLLGLAEGSPLGIASRRPGSAAPS